ncbi:MAG: phosphate signaling complex protein PhoU [Pseudomonadota bacterium]|nr:phosphate signaling complex protein PhoU [Pseudomonadota bacterium]
MTEHIYKKYDAELIQLQSMLAQMGGLAEDQLARAIEALAKRDTEAADRIIVADDKIDALELAIEEMAVLIIAKRQPMALDLRDIMVAIRVASDLERIGDLAKNIAKRTLAIAEHHPRRIMNGLVRMGKLALGQLKEVLDAYAQRDEAKALAVWRSDEDIDALYNSIFRELLTYMMEDPRTIGLCTHLLFGAKNIERIGDHCTNVAENVYYLVNGTPLTDERPKKDRTSIMPIGELDK